MNKDIRIAVSCADHPKVKKLMRRLGDGAFWNLIKFWSSVAVNKPDGDITLCDIEDIEILSGWEGEEGAFFQVLVDLGFIDIKKDGKYVHDWAQHNGWACDAEARSAMATKNQLKRWCLRKLKTKSEREKFCEWYAGYTPEKGANTSAILSVYESYTNPNTPSPSPSPSPSPKDYKENKQRKSERQVDEADEATGSAREFAENFYRYLSESGKGKKRYTKKQIEDAAVVIGQLVRIDGFDLEGEIKPSLRWAVTHDFWKGRIKSLSTLRTKRKGAKVHKFQNMFDQYLAENDADAIREKDRAGPVKRSSAMTPRQAYMADVAGMLEKIHGEDGENGRSINAANGNNCIVGPDTPLPGGGT